MYNKPSRKCPKHPTVYEPCQLCHDPNADPALGGVDWNVESNVSQAINPSAGGPLRYRPVYNPAEKYLEHEDAHDNRPQTP